MGVYKTRFGELEIKDNEVITFPNGIPGFEELRKFAILNIPETRPIQWLVSLEDENVSFPLIDPWLVLETYEVDLSKQDLDILQVEDPSDIVVWSIVTIPVGKPELATVNLKAPVVVNIKKGIGIQVILEKYELKHPIVSEKEPESQSDDRNSKEESGA
ncbi:MAG: flagellar assembly protein FliW [Fervidobacterium pennivorans]|jgi:flagellar assembly factor FliW|uniref:Flagellar assembly factor FliW n=1 Tax=Fervidobacterium pennivorans TaxID=93466 RepID=A0A7C4W6Y9_FERPE|nr:flagellar assembly protein FliW [Fervidobacterium sp.]MDM7321548.1 flagellar assembly protein FliW [Fervidobacterium sp.]NPU89558.1 flagellar assembly protein FliW [Fervidobacterium sp.]